MNEEERKKFIEKLRRAKEDAYEKFLIKKVEQKNEKAEQKKQRAEQRNKEKINIISNVQIQTGDKSSEEQINAVSLEKNCVAFLPTLTPEREKDLGNQSNAEQILKSESFEVNNQSTDLKTSCSKTVIPDEKNKSAPQRKAKLKIKFSSSAKGNYNTYKSRIRRARLTEEEKQIIREKDRLRKRKAKEDGKILNVANMSNKQKQEQKRKWRESKRSQRKKKKSLMAVIDTTPPSSDTEEQNEEINIADDIVQTTPKQELNSINLKNESSSYSLRSSNDLSFSTPSTSTANFDSKLATRKRNSDHLLSDTPTSYQLITAKRLKYNKIRKLNREVEKMRKEISESKTKINQLKRERDRYKKRLERQKTKDATLTESNTKDETPENQISVKPIENIDDSPNTKVNVLLKDRVIPEDVKKELLFGVAFKDQVLSNLAMSPLQLQNKISESVLSGNLLVKYRLHKKVAKILPYKRNKIMVKNNGKMNCNKRRYNPLKEIAKYKVRDFFESSRISRMCPGKANVITKKKNKKQKRLLNYSLKSCYSQFQKLNPSHLISFTTFYKCKPFWVVQPSLKDRETCACVKHENFKFVVSKLFNEKIAGHQNVSKFADNDYELNLPDENKNDTVTTYQWKTISEERNIGNQTKNIRFTAKVNLKMTKYELLVFFSKELPVFKVHHKTASHQTKYLEETIRSLRANECAIQIDFSENYIAKLNSEIQSMHFGASKRQISIHTGVAYWGNKTGREMASFATVSDNLDHNAYAIWCHMKPILRWLSTKFNAENLEKLYMFSDGPSSQYKNKFNIYLAVSHLKKSFPKSEVSWNFSASGHGKGPMDGVGGTIKRLADNCVSRGSDITSAKDFLNLVKPELKKTCIFEIDAKDISEAKAKLADKNYPIIQNIFRAHQITWGNPGVINSRLLSCQSCPFSDNCCHFPIKLSTATKRILLQ